MKAISLWQPWAWAILHAGKDVENRTWQTHYRGQLLLHAAQRKPTAVEMRRFSDLLFFIYEDDSAKAARLVIEACNARRGGIVGRVDIVGCRRGVESPWAFDDQYQWIVENPTPLPFRDYKGERGFFEVDYEGLVEPFQKPKKQTELF